MRLIDADAFLYIIKQVQDEAVVYRECSMDIGDKSGLTFGLGREMALENIKHRVENMPTIDAVPVVRCKDCKECEVRHTLYSPFLFCKHHGHCVSEFEYCSWGEWVAVQRREHEVVHR